MNAYLIDPFTKTVKLVEYSGDYKEIYQYIDCDCFTTVTINAMDDTIFVDDEGLFKEFQTFFQHANYKQPLAGYGLVLGCDSEGNSCNPKISIDELTNDILWASLTTEDVLFT